MVAVFEEVRRVLREDGTLWLNLGDSYNAYNANRGASPSLSSAADVARPLIGGSEGEGGEPLGANGGDMLEDRGPRTDGRGDAQPPGRRFHKLERGLTAPALKNKDLIGIPWRVAFALQDAGWWLRSDIIWSKPNPMPESVTDRPTKAHEYLFLLAKSARYYYDAEAIAEPLAEASIARLTQPNLAGQRGSDRVPGKTNWPMKAAPPRFGGSKYGDNDAEEHRTKSGREYVRDAENPGLRNARSVWTIATAPFKEAHFATFPPELPRRCILAGSRVGDTVLDPFAGAGTTLLVADRLQRHGVGIELNPKYAAMAERRIRDDAPLFAEEPK